MKETIQFTYNKWFSFLAMGFITILIIFCRIRASQLGDQRQLRVLNYFSYFLIILLIIVVYKYFIPYLLKRVSLELNELFLVDNIRNRKVNWDNILNLSLIKFRNGSSGIAISLKDKRQFNSNLNPTQKLLSWICNLSYSTPFIIPLQYVAGDSDEIFKIVNDYFRSLTI